jgi:ribosomal protein L16 Arg81 hydroxylase
MTIQQQQSVGTGSGGQPGGERLAWLIHPMNPADFLRDYWERQPLLNQRHDAAYYAGLLTLDDVDLLLAQAGPELHHVQVTADGGTSTDRRDWEIPVSDLNASGKANTLDLLYSRYRAGSTIIVNHLERRWHPLQVLSQELGADMSAWLHMNVYLTPAGASARPAHYDPHEIFIAQIHGTKRWRLAGHSCKLPLQEQPYDLSQPTPEPEQEMDLNPGDLLYMPRGTVHWATAQDCASAHITIGVHPLLYGDVLREGLRALTMSDVRFRRALPPGWAADEASQRSVSQDLADLLAVMAAALSPDQMTRSASARVKQAGLPPLRHHLADLEEVGTVSTVTPVRRRAGQVSSINCSAGTVSLHFNGRAVRLAPSTADAVQYVARAGDWFTAVDLPGDLSADERVTLLATLVTEGFLSLH